MAVLRRLLASFAAWFLGAFAAIGVGMLALSMVGDGLTANAVQPLTPDAVAREAAAAPSAATSPSAGPAVPSASASADRPQATSSPVPNQSTSSTPAKPVDKLVSSPGGTAVAQCSGASAYLVSWSPEQGYSVHDVERGPATVVSVGFRTATQRFNLSVRCVNGVPQPHVGTGDDGGE